MTPGEGLPPSDGSPSGDGGASVGDGSGDGDGDGLGGGVGLGDGDGEAASLGEGDGVSSSRCALSRIRPATVRRSWALVVVMSAFWLCTVTSCRKSSTAARSASASCALAAVAMPFIFVCRSALGEPDVQPASTAQTATASASRLTARPPLAAAA